MIRRLYCSLIRLDTNARCSVTWRKEFPCSQSFFRKSTAVIPRHSNSIRSISDLNFQKPSMQGVTMLKCWSITYGIYIWNCICSHYPHSKHLPAQETYFLDNIQETMTRISTLPFGLGFRWVLTYSGCKDSICENEEKTKRKLRVWSGRS